MSNKQQLFECEFANQLDFTTGDLLENSYRDPDTEMKWRTWCACWEAINGRFHRRLQDITENHLFGAFNEPSEPPEPCSSITILP
jgi:hypothetical protein